MLLKGAVIFQWQRADYFSIKHSLFNFFSALIKTITKFSNAIGYQQPDLSINWTVAHVMLVIGQYASFCTRCFGALCRVNCLVLQHS